MGAFLNFANNVQRLSLKRGRPPKFNTNQFYPRHLERALKEATSKEFMRVFEQFKKAALQGFTDDIKELSNENATVSTEFAGELDRIANEIVANAQNNLVKFSEMTIGKPYYPTGLENTIKENWTATFQALCISAETDAKAKIAAALSKAHDLGCNKYQTEKLVEELLPKLTKHRAELISRTETGKLNNAATMATYKGAGIEYYKWLSCIDDRTRPTHAALNNCICAVGDPESYFEENEADPLHPIKHARTSGMYIGEPGTDFQCRCSCIPWDPEIDGMYEVKEQKPEVKTPEQVATQATLINKISGIKKAYEEANKRITNYAKKILDENALKKANKTANLNIFKKLSKPESIEEAAKNSNPNYNSDLNGFDNNCQRCVMAYILRRRGYDVSAKPCPEIDIFNDAGKNTILDKWTLAFTSFKYEKIHAIKTNNNVRPKSIDFINSLYEKVKNSGSGAQFILRLKFRYAEGLCGHVIIIENINDTIKFIDPQVGEIDKIDFNQIVLEKMAVVNVTNLDFSENIFNLVQ